MLRVAIDGPGGTGKSTIAKAVASRFGLEYIDTGAMYRALGLKALRNGVEAADEDAVRAMLDDTVIDFVSGQTMLDDEDVSGLIRTNEISMAASNISKLAIVRAKVDEVSRHLAAIKDVVMEGRAPRPGCRTACRQARSTSTRNRRRPRRAKPTRRRQRPASDAGRTRPREIVRQGIREQPSWR